ncbi:MAG: cell division protein FtsQ [Rhodospirillales bacterium]|jgi:cell division protein FtsQ|nr:cell division protein FtsQ [Rhodospirillales bacterium]
MGVETPQRLASAAPISRRAPARRAKPLDRPSRLKLWLRRRRGLLRPAALGLVALAGVIGTGAAIWAADPAGRAQALIEDVSDISRRLGLSIQRVEIVGRQNTPLDMISAALGVSRGDPLLGFSLEAARARLETIAWVQRAHIERRLPETLIIRIEERRPFAIWQRDGRFVVIDRAGRVIAQDRLDQFGPLPLIVGPGANLAAATLHEMLLNETEVANRVQALVRIGERRWNLKLHSGTDVLLPEGAEAAAVTRLAALQREQQLLDRPLVAIDMRLPDRLVLRQAAAPVPETPRPTGARRGA